MTGLGGRFDRNTHANEVFDIVMKFYPENSVPAKTRFFVEELLQGR